MFHVRRSLASLEQEYSGTYSILLTLYERVRTATLLARLDEASTRLIMVTGPRQTGKTMLVRQVLDRIETPSRYLAVDEPEPATLPPLNLNSLAGADLLSTRNPVTFGDERDTRWLVRQWERARIDVAKPRTRRLE